MKCVVVFRVGVKCVLGESGEWLMLEWVWLEGSEWWGRC
jgi:hypothetical protein